MWISGASRQSSSRACSANSGSSDSVPHPFSPAVSHGWRWRILVPLSRRERTEAVLPMVADAAWSAGSTLRLFHVAPSPQMRTGPDGRVIAYVDQETDRREAESQEYLREVEARLDGVAVELRVQFGDPAHEIALEAEAFGADLIAMVTPKPRWLGPRLLGKVARRVLRRATAPVMLLRA